MNGQPKVALLIDADNVSIDVIEQAVAHLLAEYGVLHVRRAYGTAESAVKDQATFKRLGIRPMVNLATGKNSTDIALAVDAMDLAIAERPDVVAIASSDSDFAPLVARLREKGCRVVGLGQAGKTGDETIAVYDVFTVLTHRKGGTPVRGGARRGATARPAATPARASDASVAAVPPAPRSDASAATAAPAIETPRAASRSASRGGARGGGARKAATRKPAPAPSAPPPPPPPPPPHMANAEPAPMSAAAVDKMAQVLAALPELADGHTVELRLAAERLRDAGLIGRSGSSTRVFGAFPEHFELLPAKNPNKVRLRV